MHSSKSDSDVRQEQHIIEIAEEVGDRAKYRKAYDHLGNANRCLGNFHTAIDFFERNLKIAKALNNKARMATAYSNLGTCYQNLELYSEAKEYHERHLKTALEVGDRLEELHAYRNIGIAHSSSGNVDDAIEYLQRHLTLAEELDDAAEKGRAYESLGSCYFSVRNFGKAIYYYQQHLRISKETGDKIQEGIAYGNLGKAHQFQKEFELARIFHEFCLEIANETGNRVGEADSSFNIGRSYESLGHLDKALEFYKRCLSIYNDLRGCLKFEDEWKMSVRNAYQTEYASLWRLLLKQGKVIEALLSADEGRAQSLRDHLEWNYQLQTNQAETETLNRVNSRVVPSNTVFIAIDDGDGYNVAFWVLREGMDVVFRRRQINKLLGNDSHTFVGQFFLDNRKDDAKTTFYDNIIAPIQDLLIGKDLIIVPDGLLCLAPFAVFMNKDSKYLCEFFRIRVFPSLSIFTLTALCPSDYHRTTGALVVGDPYLQDIRDENNEPILEPLPCALKEAQIIAQMLNTRLLVGKEATKDEILKQMPLVALMHFATHGSEKHAAVVISPNQNRLFQKPRELDYLITAKDVWTLQLRAKLVVLSTCRNAFGKVTPEGTLSIARAFLGAGARAVIASPWTIEDEPTLELMTSFYQYLMEGKTVSEALNEAMKCLRKTEKFNKVKDWGKFLLFGDGDVILKELFKT